MATVQYELPTLSDLGRDLLDVPLWRRVISLAMPFIYCIAFFVLAAQGWWWAALLCPVLISFCTYGSTSHDLVHRNLRLPGLLNEALLSAMELLTFRSGHAYRVTHLHHHTRFPADDDIEAAMIRMPWWRALLEGITLQPRLYFFALRRSGPQRSWIIAEGVAIVVQLIATIAVLPWSPLPVVYAALVIAGSWIFPITTVLIPHDPDGASDLHRTRLYRGKVLSLLTLEHFYHLEHHLYPQVPHHNWRKLADRLDPYFTRFGLHVRKLFL
jgi:beta-carotene hydroxylase